MVGTGARRRWLHATDTRQTTEKQSRNTNYKRHDEESNREERREEVTDEQREELVATLHGIGKSTEGHGGQESAAIAGCLYALCLAIREDVADDLFHHMLTPSGDGDTEFADALGSVSGH